jgi:hypothetical protein
MEKVKKNILGIIVIIILTNNSFSQADSNYHSTIIKNNVTRNIIWYTPSNSNVINGIAIGGTPWLVTEVNKLLLIRGINLEISLVGFGFACVYVPIGMLFSPFSNTEGEASLILNRNIYCDSLDRDNITISGFNFGLLGTYHNGNINGLNLSSLSSFGYKVNGISTTIGLNLFYRYNGLLIGIQNKTTKGKGLQIGLFNNCKECKGIQIGLWNKMGKRTLPFINLRF